MTLTILSATGSIDINRHDFAAHPGATFTTELRYTRVL